MDKNQHENDDLDNALDQFDNNQLNLTGGEQPNLDLDEDPATAAKIKEEYEKFMEQMKNFGLNDNAENDGMENLTSMLGGLLTQLTGDSGLQGETGDIGKGFEEMFNSLKSENIEEAAGKLLSQFMDKSILYEPLVEAKQHYDEYFKKEEGKIPKQDQQRYKKQYAILSQVVTTLQSTEQQTPEQKQHLIQLFEKMQQLGQPPEGIAAPGNFM